MGDAVGGRRVSADLEGGRRVSADLEVRSSKSELEADKNHHELPIYTLIDLARSRYVATTI